MDAAVPSPLPSGPPQLPTGDNQEERGRPDPQDTRDKVDTPARAAAWILAVGVLVAGVSATLPREWPSVGTIFEADLTLITADRRDVQCSSAHKLGSLSCSYAADNKPNMTNAENTLRPFQTRDGKVFLIPGLFDEPSLAKRYEEEPPNVPRDRLKRFLARCRFTIVGHLSATRVRWSPAMAWSRSRRIPVATADGCEIQ